jgi:undecaprenyl-diphosphatase
VVSPAPAAETRPAAPQDTEVRTGFRPPVATALALAALVAFGLLGWGAAMGVTQGFDEIVLRWLDARASEGLTEAMLAITDLGDWQVTALVGLVSSGLLWAHGERKAALLFLVALSGTLLLDDTSKGLFGRDRPAVFDFRTQFSPSSKSYPSGHVLNATVAYTFVAYLVARASNSRWLGLVARLMAAVLIAGVGLSRIYLGVHYPTDVAGGFLLGCAWVLVCLIALHAFENRSN